MVPHSGSHAARRWRPALRRHAAHGLALLLLVAGVIAASADRAGAVFTSGAGDTVQVRNARLYLTWNAPFGRPGATDQITAACGDTTARDTLYMCFDPGEDVEAFQSFTANLYFWAAGGDSLDPHWKFGEGRSFQRLVVQYAPEDVPGTKPAWPSGTFAASGYSTSSASGKLRMIAAGPDGKGWPLKGGTTYVAARLLVPRAALETACGRPVCIEWSVTMLGLGRGRLPEVKTGQRFVSWNSKGGKVCAPMREFAAPQPWQPKLALPPGWSGR